MNERQKIEQEIICLEASLSANTSKIGDWKVIKCYEATLQQKPAPYDVSQLMADRQAVRDKINQLQEQLKNMPADDDNV